MKRGRRAGIDDRWRGFDGGPGARYGVGLRWRARYVDDNGSERSRSFTRKTDAQAWLNEITSEFVTGTYVAPEAGAVTLGELHASWSASQAHISPKTAATRRSVWSTHIEPQWSGAPVVNVKTSAVRAWVSKMTAAGVGVATIENAFGLLRQVLGAAVEDHRDPAQPVRGCEAAAAGTCRPRLPQPRSGHRPGRRG